MAEPIAIDENISTASRVIGGLHETIRVGTGDDSTPGTALFYIAQIKSMAESGIPRFGAIQNLAGDFGVTIADDPRFLLVAQGQIGYLGERFVIPPQTVGIARTFGFDYGSSHVYGLRLGLPISEMQRASQTYSTTVKTDASIGDRSVVLTDMSTPLELGFPLQAHVGLNSLVTFSGVTADGTALEIDPGYNNGGGALTRFAAAGTRVQFIYDPRVRAVAGLPVSASFQSGGDPDAFAYYPPIPADWLPIADVLVVNPGDPSVLDRGSNVKAIASRVVFYPAGTTSSPLFSTADAQSISNACRVAAAAAKTNANSASVGQLISALEQYTLAKTTNASTSFRAYWASRPFSKQPYYGRGVSFEGLSRFSFPASFAKAYFDLRAADLHHTFAIFRGDIYGNQATTSTRPLPPSTVTGGARGATDSGSTLARGTYIYGVTSTNNSGESVPTYLSIRAVNLAAGQFVNALRFSAVSGASYYHVYRRANLVGDQSEFRLTGVSQLVGGGAFADPTGARSSGLTLANYSGLRFTPGAAGYLGGLFFELRRNGTITNASSVQIQVAIYDANVGGSFPVPGALVATGTSISASALATDAARFVSVVNHALTPGATYFVRLTLSTAPTGGTIEIMGDSGGAGQNLLVTSANGTSWTANANARPWLDLYNFIDSGLTGEQVSRRGVLLTGDTAFAAQKLSVFVPTLDIASSSTADEIPSFSDDSAATTTNTQNEMVVTVIARRGATGTPAVLSVTVPRNTPRGTRFTLSNQLYDRVDDVYVTPGNNLRLGSNGVINWSIFDLITVETVP